MSISGDSQLCEAATGAASFILMGLGMELIKARLEMAGSNGWNIRIF